MKPLGRQYTKHNCKWKVKEGGKNVKGWWEDGIPPNKTRAKRLTKDSIQEAILDEVSSYEEAEISAWNCTYKSFDGIYHEEGTCMSCDFDRQNKAATSWADPNFIEACDYESYWMSKYYDKT